MKALHQQVSSSPRASQAIQLQAIAANKAGVVQRNHVDTGLKKDKATTEYAGKVKARLSGKKNPMGSTKQWQTLSDQAKGLKLLKYVNEQLIKAHVPPLKGLSMSGAAQPTFTLTTWQINLTGDLSRTDDAYLDWLIDVFYHESRHAEQWFRIARKRAGEGKTAAEIATLLSIPADIAAKAVERPLKEQSKSSKFLRSKKYTERQTKKLQEATDWDASVYGTGAAHRTAVLTGDMTPGTANYTAYENLPEELDAYVVGPKALAKYKNL
ncbi:MAG: hypothetical protein EOO60_10115 [Hymenobacter sp.]|nr:MAG: hypothetical protein EOO60_10115 [Hymenobacter sp.]